MSEARPLCLVTGARAGIGEAIARAFAGQGYDIAIADISDGPDGKSIAAAWETPGRVRAYLTDISSETAVDQLFADIEADFGQPAGTLINNAAMQVWSPMLDLSLEDWERTLRVNLTGTFLMTQRFSRRRVAAGGGGSIINLGSGCNRLAFPKLVSYTASKGGIEMLTRVSALELGEHGIRVNCISPGSIMTERTAAETEGYAQSWSALTPLGRVGTVEDVANAVVSLSSDANSFVSGQTLNVDGGLFSRAPWPQEY